MQAVTVTNSQKLRQENPGARAGPDSGLEFQDDSESDTSDSGLEGILS